MGNFRKVGGMKAGSFPGVTRLALGLRNFPGLSSTAVEYNRAIDAVRIRLRASGISDDEIEDEIGALGQYAESLPVPNIDTVRQYQYPMAKKE